MKKLPVCLVFFFIPCLALAQEKESFYTVSPEYAKLLGNCCSQPKIKTEMPIIGVGETRSSRDELLRKLLKKRKLRLYATNTHHHNEEWSIRAKRQDSGYFIGIGYETNRDPIKFLFEPMFDTSPRK